jgi:hypothetical protein
MKNAFNTIKKIKILLQITKLKLKLKLKLMTNGFIKVL